MSRLIIISGHSCTGKTTIGKFLSDKLLFPFYSKDSFKEALFNSLGTKDLEWSKQLGEASISLLFLILEEALKTKQSVIIEANFKPELDAPKLKAWVEKYNPEVLELHCVADPEVLFQRFTKRFESGERHPGHLDNVYFDKAKENFSNKEMHGSLNIGKVIEIDTTDFNKVDYEKIIIDITI